jgi:glycosyltransferase involved in cell wall biosynthesis
VTYVTTIAPTLRALGHQVTILAGRMLAKIAPDDSVYDFQQVRERRNIPRRALDGLWHRVAPRSSREHIMRHCLVTTVRRAVAERGIQLIEMEESFGWARWIRAATSIPFCIRLHGPWFLNGKVLGVPDDDEFRRRVRAEERAIRSADVVSAPSRDVLEHVRSFYGLDLPNAAVIPAPTAAVPPAERWRPEKCDPLQVLFIGRFDRHKGGDLIIEAFARVLEVIPEARLRFGGQDRGCVTDDGRTWRLKEFLDDRIPGGLESGRVQWLGNDALPFAELAQLRRGAMVSVVCSRYENLPLTVIEAMAVGCPIVAATAGGITEVIEDGVNGLLHRAGDPDDIAARIIHLLRNPGLASQLGRQAAADCERRFYPDVVAEKLAGFYRKAISERGLSARFQRSHKKHRFTV